MARTYSISRRKRETHMFLEGLAVFVTGPLLIWLSTRNRELTKYEKAGLFLMGAGTIAVDGALLAEYAKMR